MSDHIPALTGLRGIAALWVLLYHLLDAAPLAVRIGYLGVDLFFVLSGFVLMHVYHDRLRTPGARAVGAFLVARIARIYPLHLAALALVVLAVGLLPGFAARYPMPSERFGTPALVAGILLAQNWGFVLPTSWNAPAWSLSAEWAAYLAFPLLVRPVLAVRSGRLAAALAMGAVAAGVVVLDLAKAPGSATGTPGMVRLAAGFVAGCLLQRAHAASLRVGGAPALAVIAGALGLGMASSSPRLATLAFPPLVLLAARHDRPLDRLLAGRVMVFLGRISYAIYLLHWIVIQLRNWLSWRHPALNAWRAAIDPAVVVVVLVLSSLAYRQLEEPMRARIRRWHRPQARAAR